MKNSAIEWTDHTFNPWEGCTKVSEGCAHCYAEARNKRWNAGANWGPGAPRRRTSPANWNQPLQWNKQLWRCPDCGVVVRDPELLAMPYSCPECGIAVQPFRRKVFCASLADWLDDEVPIEWLVDSLTLIHATPNLDWLLLSKRLENWNKRAYAAMDNMDSETAWWLQRWAEGKPPSNVWLGTTVENQAMADKRIPELLKIPARVRFLSCEPLLEAMDLAHTCFNGADSFGTMPGIHWVIIGGESGPGARPFNIDWARDLVNQCQTAGVAPFVKQLGSDPWMPEAFKNKNLGTLNMGLKDRKGGDWSEWPEDLRIREFPSTLSPSHPFTLSPLLTHDPRPARPSHG